MLHLSTGDQQLFPAVWALACPTLPLNISWFVHLSAISVTSWELWGWSTLQQESGGALGERTRHLIIAVILW